MRFHSNNDNNKRHKIGSPEHVHQEVHITQNTPPEDNTPLNEEQTPQQTAGTLPRATHTGARYMAPGWEKFFNNYPSLDPKQPLKKATKNGGKGKSSKTTTSAKNGQHPDNKKTGK